MPWKECRVMDERCRFVQEYESGEVAMAELCRQYDISRETGYKWLNRYRQGGVEQLKDHSRAPKHNPDAISEHLRREIVQVRHTHRTWGARKILAWLARHRPELDLCAASTANEVLNRFGLIAPRKGRPKATASGQLHDNQSLAPNQLWCADFKGWFLCGDGSKCTPLTLTDQATRFILKVQSLGRHTDTYAVMPLFEAAFAQYGLPQIIRTDNGPPFASTGLGGLSHLSVRWIELGIVPERIRPGHPEENGRHERMHKTLKAETARPAMHTLALQQRRFDAWREEFNFERPHEALNHQTPGDIYRPSERLLPGRVKPWNYDDTFDEERRVRGAGQFKWQGKDVRASGSLVGRTLGLKRLSERYWQVYFRHILLGLLDARQFQIIRLGKQSERIRKELRGLRDGLAAGVATLPPSPAPPRNPLANTQPQITLNVSVMSSD